MTGGKCPLAPALFLPGCSHEAVPVLQCRTACCPHRCGVGPHFNSVQVLGTQII